MHSNMLLHMRIDAVVELVLFTYVERVGLSTLLQLAGQNFFVLYLLCALGYVALQRTGADPHWLDQRLGASGAGGKAPAQRSNQHHDQFELKGQWLLSKLTGGAPHAKASFVGKR